MRGPQTDRGKEAEGSDGQQNADFSVQTAGCRAQAAHCKLQSAEMQAAKAHLHRGKQADCRLRPRTAGRKPTPGGGRWAAEYRLQLCKNGYCEYKSVFAVAKL